MTNDKATKLAEVEKCVSVTVPCNDCGAPIPYYDGKTLCDKCFAARVELLGA